MKVIEYRRHLINGQIRDPEFITMGGFWFNPVDSTYISVLPDVTAFYVPDTLTTLTDQQLIDRVQALHLLNPYPKRHGKLGSGGWEDPELKQTTQEVEEMVREWLADMRQDIDK